MATEDKDREQLAKFAIEYVRDFLDAVIETLPEDTHARECLEVLHGSSEFQITQLEPEGIRRIRH